jgi:hypothetical protein
MPPEPPVKRAVVFVDGQNLFHAARDAFGYTHTNYDVRALAEHICAGLGWRDFSEVAEQIRAIAREQNGWIKIACAFPASPTSRNRRGIDPAQPSRSAAPLFADAVT